MDRRSLLKGLLALPVASALDGIKYAHAQPQLSAVTLRIVLDGAFAIVLQADSRWRIRVFTPIDTTGMHEFRVFGSQLDQICKGGEITSRLQNSFTLLPDGLEPSSTRPKIDRCLHDFNVATDLWCQSRYFVTIDLPAPRSITFMPPLSTVTFKNGDNDSKHPGRKGCMPSNHVLEYDVMDATKIKMAWQQKKKDVEFQPITSKELLERYRNGCDELRDDYSKDREHTWMPPQCLKSGEDEIREKFSHFKPGDLTFFFGVGLPHGSSNPDHPVGFFNDRILESFPNLKERLAIASIGGPSTECYKACKAEEATDKAVLRPLVLRPSAPQARVVEAVYSSVVDCHVTGPIVTHPAPTAS